MTQDPGAQASLYVASGRTLAHYSIDPDRCSLEKQGEVELPNTIQFGRPHPRLPVLYLSCGVGPGVNDDGDWACALALDPDTGAPTLLTPATALPGRALHLTTDGAGRHLVLAHIRPAALTVLRLADHGAIAGPIDQRPGIDVGVFPHQVRITPDGRWCICASRGIPSPHDWKASVEPQTEPGSLHVFAWSDGRLGASRTIVLGDGFHFGPRNLDFAGRWTVLGLETQNELVVFGSGADGSPDPAPRQRLSTLVDPEAEIHQGVGPVLVHPQRSVVYTANRAYRPGMVAVQEKVVPAAAENSVVVHAVDPDTGALTELQRIDSGGACPRTLSLDPTGRMLVVANSETYSIDHGDRLERVPMNLSTFRVLADGRLVAGKGYETDGEADLAWSGIASHPPIHPRVQERTT